MKEILKKNVFSDRALVRNIEDNINSLGEMANVLNNFSNVEVKEKTSLENAVYSAQLLLKHKIGEAIKVNCEFEREKVLINMNRGSLIHVIIDILNNAIEAMEGKGGVIEIETEKNKKKLLLKISNNGRSLDMKKSKYIFDPFYTTKTSITNHGLGLANAKQLMVGCGGEISVIKNRKNWTCFVLSFPIFMESTVVNLNDEVFT